MTDYDLWKTTSPFDAGEGCDLCDADEPCDGCDAPCRCCCECGDIAYLEALADG